MMAELFNSALLFVPQSAVPRSVCAGQGAQAWTNYWFTPKDRVQFSFRHQQEDSHEFVPGGGTLTDVGVRGDYWLRPNLGISGSLQYERWFFPLMQANDKSNVTAAVEILFQPQKLFQRFARNTAASAFGNGGRP